MMLRGKEREYLAFGHPFVMTPRIALIGSALPRSRDNILYELGRVGATTASWQKSLERGHEKRLYGNAHHSCEKFIMILGSVWINYSLPHYSQSPYFRS